VALPLVMGWNEDWIEWEVTDGDGDGDGEVAEGAAEDGVTATGSTADEGWGTCLSYFVCSAHTIY